MKAVLRRLASSTVVRQVTAGAALEVLPPASELSLPEGSWGVHGDHSTWLNEETAWIWPLIHAAEVKMERLVAQFPAGNDWRLAALNQAARELLLLEASDWPFLITTDQAREYAASRLEQHLHRFNRLASIVESDQFGPEEEHFLQTVASLDNPFAAIDYRVFAKRG